MQDDPLVEIILTTLKDKGIAPCEMVGVYQGPTFTQYVVKPLNEFKKKALEEARTETSFKEATLPVILGRDSKGKVVHFDIASDSHLLVAGMSGSGKSVLVHSLINSLLFERSPKKVRLIMADPKVCELSPYNGIPHLLFPVINRTDDLLEALGWLKEELESRYDHLASCSCRNIRMLNKNVEEGILPKEKKLPYIVFIIDEFQDFIRERGKDFEWAILELAAKARGVGIHFIFTTGNVSASVIAGRLKCNFPTTIAFRVNSVLQSCVILGERGAEELLGRGDMLLVSGYALEPKRIKGAYLSEEETRAVVGDVTAHNDRPQLMVLGDS